ncbi:MAG TPA: N(4)-(beta-N-acetylglucosaminyl)-L-asparaginase [Saprospiraceae bacterium]|nr:N(4)-(beta-N-acetylglucosaminyl)-L-asparaginase [Saprospiraceae bacterium]
MGHRREFLQSLGLLGLSTSSILKIFDQKKKFISPAAAQPILMCSRGEYWGKKVLTPAWDTLNMTNNILDAIERGANVCELDPEDQSVGYGGLPNERGVVQLDASIMYGPTHRCGSVASLENIKKACSVARLVMERTDHMMIVGPGALEFAKAHGFQEENLLTEEARLKWLEWKENMSDKDDWLPPADGVYIKKAKKGGTINVLGMGMKGDVAGITTTSGLFAKIPGRVGDSPIIGAGLYVDNEVGAVGATGRGEEVIRTCGSFLLMEKMKAGMTPQLACESVLDRIVEINGGLAKVDFNVKMIAFNLNGETGVASIEPEDQDIPYASIITAKGYKLITGKSMRTESKRQ